MRSLWATFAIVFAQACYAQSESDIRIVQSILVATGSSDVSVNGELNEETVSAAEQLVDYLKPKSKVSGNPVATLRGLLDDWPGNKSAGVFSGHYNCSQGQTPVTLTVVGGRFKLEGFAIFEFGNRADPFSPWGVFYLRRSNDKYDRELEFAPDAWIERPPRFSMVGFQGVVEDDTFTGRILAGGCSTIVAKREKSSFECKRTSTSLGSRCIREPDVVAEVQAGSVKIPSICTAKKDAYGGADLRCDLSKSVPANDLDQLLDLSELRVSSGASNARWLNDLKHQASFYLGFAFLEGVGVEQNLKSAQHFLRLASASIGQFEIYRLPNPGRVYSKYANERMTHVDVKAASDDLLLIAYAQGDIPDSEITPSMLDNLNAAIRKRVRSNKRTGIVRLIERLGELPFVDDISRTTAYRDILQTLAPEDAMAAWLAYTWAPTGWDNDLVTAARLGHPDAAAIVGLRLVEGGDFKLSRSARIQKSEREKLAIELLTIASRAGHADAEEALTKLVQRIDAARAAKLAVERERAEQERLRQQQREARKEAARLRAQQRLQELKSLDLQPIDQVQVQRALDLFLYDVVALVSKIEFGKNTARLYGGRVQYLLVTLKYQISEFGGCDQDGGIAVCRVTFSWDVRDEVNTGLGGLHGDMASALRGLGNSRRTETDLELKFIGEEWEVQLDPRRFVSLF